MDGTACFTTKGEFFNPVLAIGTQVSCLLVISHFFQILLKPLGQPAPLAQILAGFVLGPSGLSHIDRVKVFFFTNSLDYYETMALYSRIIIMFLIGLEIDFSYLRHNLRVASFIAVGSSFICTVFAIAVTSFIYEETGAQGSGYIMALTIAIILSNTASPFVTRLAHDLKFANTDVGRLAISSSLIADTYAVFLLIIISRNREKTDFWYWFSRSTLYFFIIVAVIFINRYAANWLNRRQRNQKYLKNAEIFFLLGILFVAASGLESMGFSSIIACFVVGLMFPRGGKAGRTLLIKLSYSVHNFVLPIYFGYTGFKADLSLINSLSNFAIVAIIILLSIGGKVTGTLAACFHLKIPLNEGVLLAFLMNLKGHVDLIAITVGDVTASHLFTNLMTVAVVINSLIWGPVIAFTVRRESDILGYKHIAFEFQSPESELKVLACVHSPRPVATMIGLIASCKGYESVAITPYLMHLIELPEKNKTTLLYHQKEEDELSDDENYGGNDVVEINDAVDIFAAETGVTIHQGKVVAPYASMYADVCEFAEDARASIIILPFHKHQRIDGKLECGKEGIRITNQKVLRHAKCSVAILVDRGLTAGAYQTGPLQHIAMLFFGGSDDREALGLSKRLGMHHHINLTLIRFLHKSKQKEPIGIDIAHKDDDVLMAISNSQSEADADNRVLTDFFNRFVISGQAGYVMQHVENGEETASALRDIAEMYSMFIVGKGSKGHSTLTTGMSDWEECPELGKVGDFLASSDFDLCGSVLIVQQYRPKTADEDDLNCPYSLSLSLFKLSMSSSPTITSSNNPTESSTTALPPPPPQLSRYESQKRRDWNTFGQYLKNQRPPVSLPQCNCSHVLEFLRYLDQFGKTKVHLHGCVFFGQPDPPAPCTCPLRQAWGSLDALIGRLRAAYEEHGGSPETNPFGNGAIRLYLREVKDVQAKARGIPYKKKKKKKMKTGSVPLKMHDEMLTNPKPIA